MIGNAYTVAETGYSVLESGELDRATFQLVVDSWLVALPNGKTLPESFASREAAEKAAFAHFCAEKRHLMKN